MRVVAEFTTEPFVGESEPPRHTLEALRVAERAGLTCELGPLGTLVTGEGPNVFRTLSHVLTAAFAHGATRVTLQVERADD